MYDVGLEVLPDGSPAYDEIIITVQRRGGKTVIIAPVTAWRCGQRGEKRTAWITAQTLKSAVRRWEEAADVINNSPLRSSVRKNRGNPQALRWPETGSEFLPFAPNEDAMHGEDPDEVFVDELWAFSLEEKRLIQQGYRPAFSVKPGRAWLMSTAGTSASEWLNEARRRGRAAVEAGQTRRIAYFEWSAPEVVGGRPIEDLPDEELLQVVLDSHPRRDHGLRPDFLAGELEDMGRIEFLRAYGNLTQNEDSVTTQGVFDSERMRANRGGQIPAGARVAFGVAVDPDRRDAVIAVAWRGQDGRALTSYRRAEGTRWLVPEVARLVGEYGASCVGIRSAGPARDIADALEVRGVPVLRLSQPDDAAAGTRFHDEFAAGTVLWDGSADFSGAVGAAEAHRVQSGLEWRSRTGGPVTCLPAGSAALWAFDHMPAEGQKFGWVAY